MDQPKKEWRREFVGAIHEVSLSIAWVGTVAKSLNADETQAYALQLCVEELVSNIVRHGGATLSSEQRQPFICICVAEKSDRIVLTVEDDGPYFDIKHAPAKRIDQPLEFVRPGSLGINLVKSFSSRLTYERRGNRNRAVAEFTPSRHHNKEARRHSAKNEKI